MQIQFAHRTQNLQPSATLAIAAKAAALKAQGKDILSLSTGEPDFDTPPHIKQAAIEAINQGFTKYTPVDGIPALKTAVIEKFQRDNQLDYESNQVLVSVGCKQSIYNLAQVLLDEGDEVIIPAPYWVSYPAIVHLAGGIPVIVQAGIDQDYKITAEQLAAAITPRTKLFMINSPSNPTGAAYTPAELQALAEVLLRHPHVIIASDDIYEPILWTDEPFANIVQVCPELYQRTVVLNGVSKSYAMTGWRIGYAAGPAELIGNMKKIQSQSTSNPTSIAQHAALAALTGDQTPITTMCEAFQRRHDFLYDKLHQFPGIAVKPSQGTFYSFPDVSELIQQTDSVNNDVEFASKLLETVGLALVPGTAFGAPGCIRLSFAVNLETLDDAVQRLAAFMQE